MRKFLNRLGVWIVSLYNAAKKPFAYLVLITVFWAFLSENGVVVLRGYWNTVFILGFFAMWVYAIEKVFDDEENND